MTFQSLGNTWKSWLMWAQFSTLFRPLNRTWSISEMENLSGRRFHPFAPQFISLLCKRNNRDSNETSFVIYSIFLEVLSGEILDFLLPDWGGKPCCHVFRVDPLPTAAQKLHRMEAKPCGGPPTSTHTTPPLHQMHFLGGWSAFPRLLAADKCVLFSFLTRVLQIHLNGDGGHSLAGPLTLWKEEKPLKC